MKQSFKSKYRNVISLTMAMLLSLGIVGATYKSWYAENINVSFHAVTNNTVTYKIFYTGSKTASFDNKKMVKKTVKGGINDVKVVLPIAKMAKFRLGLGNKSGVVNICKLKIHGDKVVELNDFADYEFNNMDSVEVLSDGSVTVVSEDGEPYMNINQTFEIYPGMDVDFVRVGAFVLILFGLFYGFFMFVLKEKKKKKKNLLDYY